MKIKLFRIYKDSVSKEIITEDIGYLKVKKKQVYTCQVDNCGEVYYTDFNPFRCKNILFNENNEPEKKIKKCIHLNQFIPEYDLTIIYYNKDENIYYMINKDNKYYSDFNLDKMKEVYKSNLEKF